MNTWAARVSVLPVLRTSEISRDASSPSTVAAASVPASSSAATEVREMKLTP